MKRIAALLAVFALAGCYNPRYPGDSPGTERPEMAPVQSGTGGSVTSSDGKPVQSRTR